jgi:hypothetical protein
MSSQHRWVRVGRGSLSAGGGEGGGAFKAACHWWIRLWYLACAGYSHALCNFTHRVEATTADFSLHVHGTLLEPSIPCLSVVMSHRSPG